MYSDRQTGSYWPLFGFVALASGLLLGAQCNDKPAPPPTAPEATSTTTAAAPAKEAAPTFPPNEAWHKEGVGPIKVGFGTEKVTAALGEPKSKSAPEMQEATGELVTRWTWDGIWAELTSESDAGPWIVATAGLNGPRYQTQRGVGVGSTLEQVKAAYPGISEDAGQHIYGDVYGGIAFTIANGKVESVFVGAQAE